MTHFAHDWDSRSKSRAPGWKSLMIAARTALFQVFDCAGEDGSDLASERRSSESRGRASGADTYGEDIAAHVRSVVENGYFEEESGKRVFVPWYIRSLLINEMHKHL